MKNMPDQTRTRAYIEVEPGVEIYYEEQGSGSPLVFIPGWTFTTEVFERQFEHFSKTHRVIAIDPRSQGRSTKVLNGNTYATQGSDVAKVIDALELSEVILVGWSTGSLTNLSYVRNAGIEKLKAVVGIDMSPKPLSTSDEDWVEGPLDEIGGAFTTYLASPKGQREFIEAYATGVMVQRKMTAAELDWIVAQSLSTPYYIASQLFADAMFSDYRPELTILNDSVPTLYVIAEHWSGVAEPFIHKHYPKVDTSVLGGHLMFWEHAERFNNVLETFINDI